VPILRNEKLNGSMERFGPRIQVTLESPSNRECAAADLPEPVTVWAEIDTGSNKSFVHPDICVHFRCPLTDVNAMPGSQPMIAACELNVRLPDPGRTVLTNIVVGCLAPRNPTVRCLIGRDLLRGFVLVYDGPADTFSLSF
jgi:hypothetical protein